MEGAAKACQRRVAPPRADQCEAGGAAVLAQRPRHGDGGEVEQVDEVSIGAEPRVGADRVGRHLPQRRSTGRGGHGQRIDAAPNRLGGALQRLQAIETGEGVGGGERLGFVDDAPRDGMHIARMLAEKRADRRVALGHPGAFVEQRRRLVEGRHIDLDQFSAEIPQQLHAGAPGCLGGGVAEEPLVRRARNADDRMRRDCAQAPERNRPRVRIFSVLAGNNLIDGPGVVDGAGKDRHAIERAAGGHHAAVGDRADRGLQADDVVEARRHAARAGRIRAERKWHEAAGHRHGRAGARSARHDRGIEGVLR